MTAKLTQHLRNWAPGLWVLKWTEDKTSWALSVEKRKRRDSYRMRLQSSTDNPVEEGGCVVRTWFSAWLDLPKDAEWLDWVDDFVASIRRTLVETGGSRQLLAVEAWSWRTADEWVREFKE